jgi:hypothetical protein
VTPRRMDDSAGNAMFRALDPETIQRAYAINLDALKAVNEILAATGRRGSAR